MKRAESPAINGDVPLLLNSVCMSKGKKQDLTLLKGECQAEEGDFFRA